MKYDFDKREIELIESALENLSECRESEVKWANGDPNIVQCSTDDINDIEILMEKIRNTR